MAAAADTQAPADVPSAIRTRSRSSSSWIAEGPLAGSLTSEQPVSLYNKYTLGLDYLASRYYGSVPRRAPYAWGFWGAVRNPGESGPGLPKRELAAWLGSVAAIFTSLFAIRALVLGDTAYGLSLLVPAMAVGAAVVATVPAGAPSPDEPAVLDQAGDGASVEA